MWSAQERRTRFPTGYPRHYDCPVCLSLPPFALPSALPQPVIGQFSHQDLPAYFFAPITACPFPSSPPIRIRSLPNDLRCVKRERKADGGVALLVEALGGAKRVCDKRWGRLNGLLTDHQRGERKE